MHDSKPTRHSTKNHILLALPEEDYQRLHPHLELVHLSMGEVINRPEEPIKYVYFPNGAMSSVIATTAGGQAVEVGVVGREGVSGIDVFLEVEKAAYECMIQLPDSALRIKTEIVKEEFKGGGTFQTLILRYVHALMKQVSQTALCNRLHTVEQRLARWLLMSHDRAESDELTLTHEFLGIMLGVNRPTVSTTAVLLQAAGFINYRRGKITVIDREGLEEFACECYEIVKQEYDRLSKQPNNSR